VIADYTVNILDSSGDTAALLDSKTLATLRFERKLNDVSVAQFTIPASHSAASLLSKHTWFEVFRHPGTGVRQFEGTYMVVLLDKFVDDNGIERLIVSGFSLEFLLLQRVVDPRNDPLMAGGWSTKQDAIDSLMAELVYEQAGAGASAHGSTPSQQVNYLTVVTPAGVGEIVPFRKAWDGLLSVLQELGSGDRMDFRIERDSGVSLKFYAEVMGADKTKTTNYPGNRFVYLTPKLGTITKPRLLQDWREEKTVVILLGKGAGNNREFFGSMASNVAETAYSYAAIVEDLRQVEDATEYIEQAQSSLANHAAKKEFSFELTHGAAYYHDLFDLGDVVTVAWDDYEKDMRVVGIKIDVSEGSEKIKPVLRGRYEQ